MHFLRNLTALSVKHDIDKIWNRTWFAESGIDWNVTKRELRNKMKPEPMW